MLLPPWNVLEQTHKVQYQVAKKQTKMDSDGGSYPAYPSGKTWDVPSGMIGSGITGVSCKVFCGVETKCINVDD